MEYEFKLTYKLPPDESDQGAMLDRLFEAGCDDAIIGVGVDNQICLDFIREAASADAAISSAMSDVLSAIPNAQLVEVGPDLVGLSDAAKLLDISRQYMRTLMLSNPEFPLPVHAGSTAIWHFAPLLRFVNAKRKANERRSGAALYEVATSAMAINFKRHQASTFLETTQEYA